MGFRTSIQNINFIAHLIEENVYAFLQQSIFSNEMLLTNVFPIPANSRITTYTYNVETREEGIYRMTRLTKNNAAGNTSTGIWSVVYNADNRPVSFTKTEGDQTTLIECDYDYMGRRYMKKVTVNGAITLHHRYIYRGYLQIACVDLTRNGHPALWLTMWDPSEPVATRPLAIQKNATWYSYGHDLTKNITELYHTNGTIATAYDYTPYGAVTSTGIDQAFQWSSEVYDAELALVYYNYRHYNPMDGRWIGRDSIEERGGENLYVFVNNKLFFIDELGLDEISFSVAFGAPLVISITIRGVSDSRKDCFCLRGVMEVSLGLGGAFSANLKIPKLLQKYGGSIGAGVELIVAGIRKSEDITFRRCRGKNELESFPKISLIKSGSITAGLLFISGSFNYDFALEAGLKAITTNSSLSLNAYAGGHARVTLEYYLGLSIGDWTMVPRSGDKLDLLNTKISPPYTKHIYTFNY